MSKRIAYTTLLALIALTHACLAAGVAKPTPNRGAVIFPEWGFSAEIPTPYEKFVLPCSGDVLSNQIFVNGEYAYMVKVTKAPANTLASTYIEKVIQAYIKAAPAGSSKRWELDSRQGDLFKGVTIPLTADLATNTVINKVLNGHEGAMSIAMAPIKDETSPVLTVGVISTDGFRQDSENRTSVLATFLKFTRTGGATKPTAGAPKPPAMQPGAIKPPAAPATKPIQPKPTTPAGPMTAPRYTLKTGEIELTGTVTSISGSKSLNMTVDAIRMPGGSSITLNPPVANKKVLLKSLPAGLKVGAKIIVAGKNLGKGTPITAASISCLSPSNG